MGMVKKVGASQKPVKVAVVPKRQLGIVEKPPIQKGRKPFFYFRGPIVDAGGRHDIRSVPEERIRQIFRTLGLSKFPENAPEKLKKGLEGKVFEMRRKGEREGLFLLDLGNRRVIPFKVVIFEKRREVLVYQQPLVHFIIRESGGLYGSTESAFGDLKKILAEGFRGNADPNSTINFGTEIRYAAEPDTNKGVTKGDQYSLEFMKPAKKEVASLGIQKYFVNNAKPSQIVRVNIYLRQMRKGEKEETYAREIKGKKEWYRSELRGHTLRFLPS